MSGGPLAPEKKRETKKKGKKKEAKRIYQANRDDQSLSNGSVHVWVPDQPGNFLHLSHHPIPHAMPPSRLCRAYLDHIARAFPEVTLHLSVTAIHVGPGTPHLRYCGPDLVPFFLLLPWLGANCLDTTAALATCVKGHRRVSLFVAIVRAGGCFFATEGSINVLSWRSRPMEGLGFAGTALPMGCWTCPWSRGTCWISSPRPLTNRWRGLGIVGFSLFLFILVSFSLGLVFLGSRSVTPV